MGSANEQGQLWGAQPDGWSTIQEPQHGPLMQAMLEAAGVGPGTRLLDAGCGAGFSSAMALARGAHVTGLDAAEGLIEYARRAAPQAEFRVGDIQELPFEDGSFDVVFAANSVQYAAELIPALQELGRVCAPGGRIVAGLFGPPEGVAYASVFKAVAAELPPPPPDAKPGGPFLLSAPGVLANKFIEAGLQVSAEGDANCPFDYADFDEHWRATSGAGPFQKFIGMVGEERLRVAVEGACAPFTAADGKISIQPNVFVYVVATR